MKASPTFSLLALVCALVFTLSACSDDDTEGSGGSGPGPSGGSGGPSGGSGGPGGDGGVGGGGSGPGGDGGGVGGGGGAVDPGTPPDPTDPGSATRDFDCDGLSDAEEYTILRAGGATTDPENADTDGDGIPDGVEVGRTTSVEARCRNFRGDQDPTTTTDPLAADTDGDGTSDGAEERNRDGRVDAGECDPSSLDSDGDGLPDATEDLNHDGTRQPGETDACARDTDADGIPDGVEDVNRDGLRGPTETDPRLADTDGDGASDGAEDVNWNHVVDAGESDPLVGDPDSDGDGMTDAEEARLGTNPNARDSDGDGLDDPLEDSNRDGQLNAGETNPLSPDTDCDGLSDGAEDADHDGARGPGESDPRDTDSDGDLLGDGLERGATSSPDPACAFPADADPATTTDPTLADTDGDGINDGIEDTNRDGRVDLAAREYDPANADTDRDGIQDGTEDQNDNHRIDPGETDPLIADVDSDGDGITDPIETNVTLTDPGNPDTDNDGLNDGREDRNRDGQVNLGETSALSPDTDCDGLADGIEDANHDGVVAAGETDPTRPDTDGDGLTDGQELGRTSSPELTCGVRFVPDGNPGTTTNPTNADSDGDGIQDGAEDADHDGVVDLGELDPSNGADATPTVVAACATGNLAPITLSSDVAADLILAHRPAYAEVATVTRGGANVGTIVFAPGGGAYPNAMAGFAIRKTPSGGDALAEELADRAAFGGLSSPVVQSFTTWDGYPAVRGLYDLSGGGDLKGKANALVSAMAPGAGGLLVGNAGANGPFKLLVEYVVRSPQTAIVVGSVLRASDYTGDNLWRLDDLANGSSLGQFGDETNVACERFDSTARPMVDFLWVVDNSGSMDDDQAALSSAGTEMVNALAQSQLDWRIATVYTDSDRTGTYRAFTTNTATFQSDVTPGTNGSGTERGFQPVQDALADRYLNGGPAAGDANRLRPGATLVVVFVSDELEQSGGTEASWQTFFEDYDPTTPGAQRAFLTGLIYPGVTGQRYRTVINALGGIEGDLSNLGTIGPTIQAMMSSIIGQTSPYELSNPPVSATIKIAVGAGGLVAPQGPGCNNNDLPRSRSHGFDYDGIANRISFFGDCRPTGQGTPIAVSYRFWIDRSPNPNGTPQGCGGCAAPLVCNPVNNQCECPADCGGGAPGPDYVCDTQSCTFVCPADCGGCGPGLRCDTGACGCACDGCGGVAPGPGFVCDPTSCQFTCDATCGGQPQPTGAHVCDRASCTWECPADCGVAADPSRRCDPQSCTTVCMADCGGTCGGNERCDTTTCGCECRQNVTCQPGFRFDPAACSCVCDTAAISCAGNYVADPAACGCACPLDCGGTCQAGCDLATCTCLDFG